MPPQWWATFDVDLYWSNAGAGSGDVTWRARSAFITDGDTVAVPSGTSTDATAPAQNVAEVTTILSGVTLTAGELLQLFIQRVGGSGTDTLGNDAALLGVMLRQVS